MKATEQYSLWACIWPLLGVKKVNKDAKFVRQHKTITGILGSRVCWVLVGFCVHFNTRKLLKYPSKIWMNGTDSHYHHLPFIFLSAKWNTAKWNSLKVSGSVRSNNAGYKNIMIYFRRVQKFSNSCLKYRCPNKIVMVCLLIAKITIFANSCISTYR